MPTVDKTPNKTQYTIHYPKVDIAPPKTQLTSTVDITPSKPQLVLTTQQSDNMSCRLGRCEILQRWI